MKPHAFKIRLLVVTMLVSIGAPAGQTLGNGSEMGISGVSRRVPQDYPSIQAAIDASSDGDTVLISEGTYFENIRYRGKAITVGSLYLLDGDTSHIRATTIDGSRATQPDSGSVVCFADGEDTTSVLCGVTIQGGSGTKCLYHSYLGEFWMMAGGGVLCDSAGARLTHTVIARNRLVSELYPQGGGLCAIGRESFVPTVLLDGNYVVDNYVEGTSDVGVTTSFGGGACFLGTNARLERNTFERDTIISVIDAHGGGVAFIGSMSQTLLPDAYIEGNAFRSNAVMGTPGTAAGGGLVTWLTGDVLIRGNIFENNTVTSVAQWACGGGLFAIGDPSTVSGETMVLNNDFLKNSVHSDVVNAGGGVSLYRTSATVSGNRFVENSVGGSGGGPGDGPGGGAGISAHRSSFRIENNIISRNVSAYNGGGMLVSHSSLSGSVQVILHNTVVENQAAQAGGGLCVYLASGTVVLNSIFWKDTAAIQGSEIFATGAFGGVRYCDVKGGYSDTGNIDADPAFAAGDPMFNLDQSSPCIGRGTDSSQIGGVWYRAPDLDYDGDWRPRPVGTSPDIGAQEDQSTINGVDESDSARPEAFELNQNYPNPFNPSTTVTFKLPRASSVRLGVYDVLGREVAVLVNEKMGAGVYEVAFVASGLPSGVYIYRLVADDYVLARKLTLLR
jgi:hypothetical protein